jgi:hypothetical protein
MVVLMTSLLLAACSTTAPHGGSRTTQCVRDRAQLLALDEQQFDQDLTNGGGGWRAVANQPGCEAAAADLIRDYRQAHRNPPWILSWHEGQMRAFAGDYTQATALLRQARQPADQDDSFGWNPYVDATIAFLSRDRAAALEARSRLAAIAPVSGTPVTDGYITLQTTNGPTLSGPTVKIKWPPNLDVVDGLIRCFDQPYKVAYGGACRSPPGPLP